MNPDLIFEKLQHSNILYSRKIYIHSRNYFLALVAEMVEPPQYGPEYDWLWVVKYIGYVLSILLLIVFMAVIIINPFLWEMFHLIRFNTALCVMVALICMFVAENEDIRKNRHENITFSVFQQFWFLAACLSLLSESFATFRAITGTPFKVSYIYLYTRVVQFF